MSIHKVDSLDDLRLNPYRALKERDVVASGRFIAEGEHLVKRLLASEFRAESVFIAEKHLEEIAPLVPANVPLLVGPHELMHEIIGYKFHSGIIACGLKNKPRTIDDVISRDGPLMVMVLPEIANAENLGGLIRVAAGFGVDAIILGERSCDPFLRQSVRVSMGTIFKLPLVEALDMASDLKRLRGEYGVELCATVLDADAEDLNRVRRSERMALVFGNEAQGLSGGIVELCDRKITIPMQLGTDSLNVAVSAGIFLYHFTR